jgi:hypothetical protein
LSVIFPKFVMGMAPTKGAIQVHQGPIHQVLYPMMNIN